MSRSARSSSALNSSTARCSRRRDPIQAIPCLIGLASAALSVLPRQRRRIARAASAFLMMRPDLAELALRFDVMLVAPLRPPRHLPDAWRIDS